MRIGGGWARIGTLADGGPDGLVPHEAQERLWTITEAAAYLQVPASSIYKMTARAARLPIPHVRLAGRLRFRRESLDEWLELLAVSSPDTLRRVRRATRRATNGHYPQAQDRRR